MNTAKYFFLIAALLININCSVIQNAPTTTPAENKNSQNTTAGTGQENANNASTAQQNASAAPDQQNAPDALIKDLYQTHGKDNGKILNGKSRTLIDKYFDKNLGDLIWKDLTSHQEEVGVIDFDLFYNAQDADIKKLNVAAPKIEGTRATVVVTFENFGKKQAITYLLNQQKAGWKISDINYGEGNTLLKYFKEDAQNNAADKDGKEGNFEGTYQVGDTTCTVKPIKMAFEVKWAKGNGTMIFFFVGEGEDQFKYSSENKGSGVDTFNFDDATLTNGKFIRADGKEMTVKKVK